MGSVKAKVIIIEAILIALFFMPIPDYMGRDIVLSSLTHHFFHVNILHLVCNCLAVYFLYSRKASVAEFLIAFAIGSAAYFVAPIPTIGYSDILFATMGLRTPSLKSSWWKSGNTILFLITMALTFLIPNISSATHLVSFFVGVALACVARVLNNISADYAKAK